ncbi:MAG: VWA domain-containing protein [Planctomycetota bacterium]
MLLALQEAVTEIQVDWLHAPAAWVITLVIVPAVVLFAFWVYQGERGNLSLGRRVVLGALRVLVVLGILAFLAEPILTKTRVQRENSFVLVVIDDSYSMGIVDRYSDEAFLSQYEQALGEPFDPTATRLQIVRKILTDEQVGLIDKIRRKANVRIVAGSEGLKQIVDLPRLEEGASGAGDLAALTLELRGKETRLGDSIYEAVNDLRGDMIAGVVLLSDGRDNGGVLRPEEVAARFQRREIPIHTVGVGNPDEPRDIRVFGLTLAEVVLKDDIVPVDFNIVSEGFEGRRVEVRLKLVNTETGRPERGESDFVALRGNAEVQTVRMQFRPLREGKYRATVEVELLEGEIFEDNNRVEKLVTVLAQKIKVLYVDSSPRWEYRFLTWALVRDPTMEAQVLLTSADSEWIPDSTPGIPPVFEFPRTKEELFAYHLVIVGDVEPNALTPEQKEWLVEFVDDLGGGVVFIAGPWYLPQKYRGDTLEKLFPVELQELEPSFYENSAKEFHVLLTPEGREHPVMQLDPDTERNVRMWQSSARAEETLPGFYWYAKVKKLRRGGVALAVHEDDPALNYGNRPIFAYQYLGRGRTFVSLVDSTWRWRRFRGNTVFYRFWGQVFRFASAGRLLGKTQRFAVSTDQREYTLGQDVRVLVRALDREFKPMKEADRPVFLERVDPPLAERKEVVAVQVAARPEYYETVVPALELGEHKVWIEDREEDVASANYRVVVPQLEYAEPRMDRPRLRQIAERSGGSYHEVYEVGRLADRIESVERQIPISSEHRSLWDSWWLLVSIAALLTLEWVLRKVFRLL